MMQDSYDRLLTALHSRMSTFLSFFNLDYLVSIGVGGRKLN